VRLLDIEGGDEQGHAALLVLWTFRYRD